MVVDIEAEKSKNERVPLPHLTSRFNTLCSTYLGLPTHLYQHEVKQLLQPLVFSQFVSHHFEVLSSMRTMMVVSQIGRPDLVAAIQDQPFYYKMSVLLESD